MYDKIGMVLFIYTQHTILFTTGFKLLLSIITQSHSISTVQANVTDISLTETQRKSYLFNIHWGKDPGGLSFQVIIRATIILFYFVLL